MPKDNYVIYGDTALVKYVPKDNHVIFMNSGGNQMTVKVIRHILTLISLRNSQIKMGEICLRESEKQ